MKYSVNSQARYLQPTDSIKINKVTDGKLIGELNLIKKKQGGVLPPNYLEDKFKRSIGLDI